MRKRVITVFDDYVTTTAITTSSKFNDRLGSFDQLGLLVVADNGPALPTVVDIWIEHSGDGINWLPARRPANQSSPFHVTPGDVSLTVSSVVTAVGFFSHAATGVSNANTPSAHGPHLGFVRLYLVSSTGQAHVRVHAFHRDHK